MGSDINVALSEFAKDGLLSPAATPRSYRPDTRPPLSTWIISKSPSLLRPRDEKILHPVSTRAVQRGDRSDV